MSDYPFEPHTNAALAEIEAALLSPHRDDPINPIERQLGGALANIRGLQKQLDAALRARAEQVSHLARVPHIALCGASEVDQRTININYEHWRPNMGACFGERRMVCMYCLGELLKLGSPPAKPSRQVTIEQIEGREPPVNAVDALPEVIRLVGRLDPPNRAPVVRALAAYFNIRKEP